MLLADRCAAGGSGDERRQRVDGGTMIGKLNEIEERALKEFKETLVKRFGGEVRTIRLFGSKARGDFRKESDMDILVLMKEIALDEKDWIIDASFDLLLKYNVLISPIVIAEERYQNLLRLQTAFIRNVMKEGIDL